LVDRLFEILTVLTHYLLIKQPFIMKKFLLIVLAAGLMFSCQKKGDETAALQDVSFSAIELTPDVGLKAGNDVIPCITDVPTNAWVQIEGVDYYPALFTLDGKLYTQAIKLPVGTTYTVQQFVLYKESGTTPKYQAGEDVTVYATPLTGTTYAEYVTTPLTFDFTVTAFAKAQVDIQVLCFQDHLYTEFGFNWFAVTEIVVREQCFFGDICVKHPADYHGSDYDNQTGGVKIDMPAIFKIKAFKNGVALPAPYNEFTNDNAAAGWGVGAPVCVTYPDNLSINGEVFTFELYIMVKQGNNFPFVLFHTWTFTDANMIPAGDDGVVDFVLGSCNLSGTDLQLAPWQNLPTTATVTIAYPGNTLYSYWDVQFNSYTPAAGPGNYDLPDAPTAVMAGWCGDKFHTIAPGGPFAVNIYPSLNNSNWPAGMPFTIGKISQVNWLMNHLANFGYNLGNNHGGDGGPLQQAIWQILNGYPAVDPLGIAMAAAAQTTANETYVPLPGGWAAVLMIKNNTPLEFQLIFVVVDP